MEEQRKSHHPILTVFLIFAVLILASAIIWGTVKLTSNVILSENQENNQINYNPSNQENEQSNQQKDWYNINYNLKKQIKSKILQYNLPIYKVDICSLEKCGWNSEGEIPIPKGKPVIINLYTNKEFLSKWGENPALRDPIYQVIKNFGFESKSLRVDYETEAIYIQI